MIVKRSLSWSRSFVPVLDLLSNLFMNRCYVCYFHCWWKNLVSQDLLNSEFSIQSICKNVWNRFDNFCWYIKNLTCFQSRFNILFSISGIWNTIKFEIFICTSTFYCNDNRMIFILLCFVPQYDRYLLTCCDILE